MDAVSIGGDSKMSAADNSDEADSTNIRGRRGGISSNNNAMYGDATKSNDNRPPSNRGRGRSGGMSLNNSMYGDGRLGVCACTSRTSLPPTKSIRSRKNRGGGYIKDGNENNNSTINSPDPKKKARSRFIKSYEDGTKLPFGNGDVFVTQGDNVRKTRGRRGKRKYREEEEKKGIGSDALIGESKSGRGAGLLVGGSGMDLEARRDSSGEVDFLEEASDEEYKKKKKKSKSGGNNNKMKEKSSSGNKRKGKKKKQHRSEIARNLTTTNESQGSIAVGIFSCSKVVAAYDAVRRLEAEQKHYRSKNNDQSSIVALEFKKFESLHTYIEALIVVEPSDEERNNAMILYEKDTDLRNKAKLGGNRTGAKLTDEEEQSIDVVKTWNVQAASAVCSTEKSIGIIQELGMKAPAKFAELCHSFTKLKEQVIESIKAPSTVDVPTRFRYVMFMQNNGVSPRILFAMDEFMARKLTDDDHPVAHALYNKLHFCEKATASLGTPNQMSDQEYFSTYKKLEEKDAKETRDTTFPNGLYVKGNKVVPRGTEGSTEIIKPGGSLELNQMDGVKAGLLCLILLHWTSPTKDGMTDMGKGCITMANTVGPSYAHIEAGGVWTDEVKEQVDSTLGVHDTYDLVYKDKQSWGLQTNAFGDIVGFSEPMMEARGVQRQQAQILGNCLAGKTTRVAVCSAEAQRRAYSFLGATGNPNAITCGPVAHTQAQQTPGVYMTDKDYSQEDLYNQSAALTILFSPVERLIVSATSQVMLIIAMRTNEKKLTPEMKAIKDAALKKQRHENSKKGWETRKKASDYDSTVKKEERSDSSKQAWETRRKASDHIESLSDNIFGINAGLNESSNAEDVKAVLEKLKLSPDSNNEASVAFDKLKLHEPTTLSQLPALSAKLLRIHRDRVKRAKVKTEKAQTQAVNRQALLSAHQWMAYLRKYGYERLEVTAGPKSLGVHMDNMPMPIGLLHISLVKSNSQLKGKVSVGDVIFCLDGQFVYHTSHHDMKKIVYDKRENPIRVFEIWRRSK